MRSAPGNLGRPDARTCILEVRGDARHFKLNMLTEDSVDALNYQALFTPDPHSWQTVHLPLSGFRPTFRGREVPGAPALAPERIRQVGLMTAERQTGPFALAIRRIALA